MGRQAGGCCPGVRVRRPHRRPRPQMLSFMHAQHSFFRQGYSLLHQLDPYMQKLAAEVGRRAGRGRGQGPEGAAPFPSLTPLPTAGPAGDRLSSGEAGDGAQARCHPAAGEALPCLLGVGVGGRDPKRPPPPTLSILWAARLTVHTRSILSPRPAPLPGSPSAGLHVREQEWGAALRLLRDQDRGGQRVSPQCTHPGPSFKASGDRGSPSLAPTARLSPSHCQTVAPTLSGERWAAGGAPGSEAQSPWLGGAGPEAELPLTGILSFPPPRPALPPQTLLQVSGRPPEGGRQGRASGRGLCPPSPRGPSAPRTPPAGLRAPRHLWALRCQPWLAPARTRAAPGRMPRGSSSSCAFLAPLGRGSRWPGLRSHCGHTGRHSERPRPGERGSVWREQAQLAT